MQKGMKDLQGEKATRKVSEGRFCAVLPNLFICILMSVLNVNTFNTESRNTDVNRD